MDDVTIHYTKKPGDYIALTLALPVDVMEDKNLPEFMEGCSTASFGIGGQTVTDPTYRDALKLDPDCFSTDFELANTTILGCWVIYPSRAVQTECLLDWWSL